jgi:hypothetical protein
MHLSMKLHTRFTEAPRLVVPHPQVAGEWHAPGAAAAATSPLPAAASPYSFTSIPEHPSDTCSESDEDDTHSSLRQAAGYSRQEVEGWDVRSSRDQVPHCTTPSTPGGASSGGGPGAQPSYKWHHML